MSYSIDRILYATELEPDSPRVFRHEVGIARQFNAKLHILTVSQTKEQPLITDFLTHEDFDRIHTDAAEALRTNLESRIDAFCASNPDLDARGVIAEVRTIEGSASREILAMANRIRADLIVLGSHGHSALGEMLMGSVAHKVTVESHVPVLLVPINH
jgi:nucleotide-binding universal stress UspA family protein